MNNYLDGEHLEWLALLANLCQVASFQMNISEVTNGEIMKRLERQDSILDEQTNFYLKKIIKQNEQILSELKKLNAQKAV